MSSLLRVVFDPDTTPPGIPTLATPTVVGQTRLDLSWTSVTDTGGSGLAGYDVLIDGVTVVQTGVQTTYSATGFTAGTTHTFRVRARDGNGNTSAYSNQVQQATAAAPAVYNPAYPRFGSYSLGGTQSSTDAALAQTHVNIVINYPGWAQGKNGGVSWATKAAAVKALSTIGTKLIPYTIYPEIPDINANAGQAFWEVWQQALNNNLWVFQNGLTETTRIPSYETSSAWSKLNYTTAGKLVNGENFGQWKMRWDYRLNVQGGSFSNGSTTITVAPNPSGFDGTFFDNVFAQERPATTGATGDYNRDGTQDTLSSAASRALIQSSHAALCDFYQTLHPGAYVLANSADWPIYYPSGISSTPLNQKFHGGLMEHAQEWIDGTRGSTMSSLLNAIQVQMNGFQPPKLGVLSVLIPSATNYAALRYWFCINALVDTYFYPHTTETLLAQELGTLAYDERGISMGTASDPVQTTARYQGGANGTGIYRRDFANHIVLVAAPGATYSAQALGGTFYRLNGTLDPTTNNAQAVTSVTMTAGTGLVLSRTPTASTAGFTPASSTFTVQAPSGIGHNLPLVITRTTGSWAARPYGAASMLYDVGDVAYHGGTAKTPMAVYTDGQQLPENVSGGVWLKYGQDPSSSAPSGHNIKLARSTGTRSPPNARTTAWWYSTTGFSDMKCELMEPIWPTGWPTRNHQRIYVSFWFRPKTASRIINNGKFGRFNEGGANYFYPRGSNTSLGNIQETGPYPTVDGQWWRLEYYLDFDLDVLDLYGGYRYQRQVSLGETSPGPREWRNSTPYNAVSNRAGYLYTAGGQPQANQPMTIGPYAYALAATLGFDGQSGAVHSGQEYDIANFYCDPEWERFEISDSPTWSLAPNAFGSNAVGTPREVQGRWSRDSNSQCTVYINQGQFTNLSGKYLWYVDDFKTATLIGQFT